MRKTLVGLVALTLLTAMGPRRPDISESGETQELFSEFKQLAQAYGTFLQREDILFSFETFFWGSTAGVCYYQSRSPNRIELSSSHWSRGSETFKEMLLFHELGHCAMGRGHNNGRYSDGRPESLMNSWLFNQQLYRTNREQYLKELFTVNPRVRSLRGHFDPGDCTFGHD